MNQAHLNPYESPQGTSDRAQKPEPQELLTLAELQARVIQLEEKLKASRLFGPLWKRCLTVFVYFFLGYAIIFLACAAVFYPLALLFNWIDY